MSKNEMTSLTGHVQLGSMGEVHPLTSFVVFDREAGMEIGLFGEGPTIWLWLDNEGLKTFLSHLQKNEHTDQPPRKSDDSRTGSPRRPKK